MARPQLEIVHVGSACRDIDPSDPRGWRLGGGVTYAALTTARLGLRTAAIVGADAEAAASAELDTLRDAGVDVLVVPLEEGPVFHNVETPKGRVQTCIQRGVPLPIPPIPVGWLAAAGWSIVPVADEIPDALGRGDPGGRLRRGGVAGLPARAGAAASASPAGRRGRRRSSTAPTSSGSATTTCRARPRSRRSARCSIPARTC